MYFLIYFVKIIKYYYNYVFLIFQKQYFRNRESSSCLAINDQANNILITMNCDESNQLQKWLLKDSLFENVE